jgi:hypothetical protein
MENDPSQEGLGCCACEEKSMGTAGLTCADKKNIFTGREHEVLDRIREASLRASALKEEIRLTDEDRRESALQELERLRLLRAELEEERIAASDERMRMLGHL